MWANKGEKYRAKNQNLLANQIFATVRRRSQNASLSPRSRRKQGFDSPWARQKPRCFAAVQFVKALLEGASHEPQIAELKSKGAPEIVMRPC